MAGSESKIMQSWIVCHAIFSCAHSFTFSAHFLYHLQICIHHTESWFVVCSSSSSSSSMDSHSHQPHSLSALFVFKHSLNSGIQSFSSSSEYSPVLLLLIIVLKIWIFIFWAFSPVVDFVVGVSGCWWILKHLNFLFLLLFFFAELVRSLHAYRFEDGKEIEVEREFLFSEDGSYVEMAESPFLRLQKICISQVSDGCVIGSWVCFFAFGPHHPPILDCIPPILMISR